MEDVPLWLPELILLENYDGCWQRYEDEVYSRFYADFIESKPVFQKIPVYVERPLKKGKEQGFWHCIQQGPVEENRTPDLRRCERIAWIRAVIEHSSDPAINKWPKKVKSKLRHLLWFQEKYLVVLEKRRHHWVLRSAYCTTRERTKARLKKEYKASLK